MKNGILIVALVSLLAACGKRVAEAEDAKAAAKTEAAAPDKGTEAGVELEPAEVASLGVVTAALQAASHVAETPAFAVVLDHDRVAQAVADIATARAAVQQSRAALDRVKRLAGTEGAETLEAREAAERQAAADSAALALAERKSATVLGQHPPWSGAGSSPLLDALASGRAKLIRVTFPLGSPMTSTPTALRLARLDGVTVGQQWHGERVWPAPADPDVPGRSFFTVLDTPDLGEGEHLAAWASQGKIEEGVIVPAAAVLADSGRFWCFLERSPGKFTRVTLDIDQPAEGGYFVGRFLKPGDPVVVAAAGLLLARELHPGAEAD